MTEVQHVTLAVNPDYHGRPDVKLIGVNYHHVASGRIVGQLKRPTGADTVGAMPEGPMSPVEPHNNSALIVHYMTESFSLMAEHLKVSQDLASEAFRLRGLLEGEITSRQAERREEVQAMMQALIETLESTEKHSQEVAAQTLNGQYLVLCERGIRIESYLRKVLTGLHSDSSLRLYIYNHLTILAQTRAKIEFILGNTEKARLVLEENLATIKSDAKSFIGALTKDVDPRDFAPNNRARHTELLLALEQIDDKSPMDRMFEHLNMIGRVRLSAQYHPLFVARMEKETRYPPTRPAIPNGENGKLYRKGDRVNLRDGFYGEVQVSGYLMNMTHPYEGRAYTLEVPCLKEPSKGDVDVMIECGHLISKAKSLVAETCATLENPRLAQEFATIHLDYGKMNHTMSLPLTGS